MTTMIISTLSLPVGMLAYVGPGPGLSMTWALWGPLATLFAAISAIALWPLRVLLRRLRGKTRPSTNATQQTMVEA